MEEKNVESPKMVQRMSKQLQLKINEKIPDKAHQIITDAIKNFVKVTLAGSQLTMKKVRLKTEHWNKEINS